MPSIKDESTVEAIAREYCSNGRNEEQAMLTIGYTKTYARSGLGHRIYADIRLKAAIARIDAVQAQIGHRTVENLDKMYQQGFDVAKTQNNPTGMATNTTGIARLYNMDQAVGEDIKPELSPAERKALQALSKAATGPKLSKEKIA